MSDSTLYVVIAGPGQESKCHIANVLANKNTFFSTFVCRVKSLFTNTSGKTMSMNHTVNGLTPEIHMTSSIGTPIWEEEERNIKTMKNKVIIYVESDDLIDINHDRYIKKLRDWCHVIKVKCNLGLTVKYDQTCDDPVVQVFGNLDIDNTDITFNCCVLVTTAQENIKCVLEEISRVTQHDRPSMEFEGSMAVDDRRDILTENAVCDDESALSDKDKEAIESVNANGACADEVKITHLPPLDDEDWNLYARTLSMGTATSNLIRVNIVGNGHSGKATLVKRLQDIPVDLKKKVNQSRHVNSLEIYPVTTKCVEKDKTRAWKTETKGYEHELNVQRMALAMQKTKTLLDEQMAMETSSINPEQSEQADVLLGSDEIEGEENVTTCQGHTYSERHGHEIKRRYLQEIKAVGDCYEDKTMYISYWNLSGLPLDFSINQAFMSASAVYILVFDLSIDLDTPIKSRKAAQMNVHNHYTLEETLKTWVSSIKAFTTDCNKGPDPLVIVGTRYDKVTEEKAAETFSRIRKALKDVSEVEFIHIDNTLENCDDQQLHSLKNKILDLGLGVIDEEVPAKWIQLEQFLILKKMQTGFLTFEEIKQLDTDSDNPIRDESELIKFLEYEHGQGFLMFFKCDVDNPLIILDPTLLIELLNALLQPKPQLSLQSSLHDKKRGIVKKKFIVDVARKTFTQSVEIESIVAILKDLHIVHTYKDKEGHYFIAPLLPKPEDLTLMQESPKQAKSYILRFSFSDAFMPPFMFLRLFSAMYDDDLQIRHVEDEPVFYRLFVSFNYNKTKTIHLDIYWEKSKIYITLKNYSKKHSCDSDDIWNNVLTTIKKKIEMIMSHARHKHVKYYFEVPCNEHPDRFVNLNDAQTDGEAMCLASAGPHAVTYEEICGPIKKGKCCYDQDPQKGPTYQELGRLARYLSRENPQSLAAKVKLKECNNSADEASANWPENTEMQRLQILSKWKQQNPKKGKGYLLKHLSKLDDRTDKDMAKCLMKKVKEHKYSLDDDILKSKPSEKVISMFSRCIGKQWPFLMMELGFTIDDIDSRSGHDSLPVRVQSLLKRWKQEYPEIATVQVLLDTAHFVGVTVEVLVKKLNDI